jgi:pimeloyl-ACP methyl ester carboxylesterase
MNSVAVDGHELAWEARGEGRTIFFVHGLAIDRRVMIAAFEPSLESASYQRVYVDLPGHGESRGNPARMGADALVAALAALLAEVGGEAPLLCGYSYGGYLLQGLIRERPDAGGALLVCPTVEADFGKRTLPPRRVAARDDDLAFSDDSRERIAFEEIAVVQTHAQLAQFQRVIHPANIAADQELMGRTRAEYAMARPYVQNLSSYERPVAIVSARDDHWVGWEDALRLCRAFRQARWDVLPDCGHLLPFEQPDRFRALVADWLSRV